MRIKRKIYFFCEQIFFSFFHVKQEFQFIGLRKYIQYWIFQKIFGINRYVPWPVHHSSIVTSANNISFKKEINPIGYSPCSYIQASNKIIIGTNVIIGPGVSIISDNHNIFDFTKYTLNSPIIINDNSWLGANVTILAGVELGKHTIVAAGAVVTKSFKEGNCIIGGVPAKKIKDIDNYKSKVNYYDI